MLSEKQRQWALQTMFYQEAQAPLELGALEQFQKVVVSKGDLLAASAVSALSEGLPTFCATMTSLSSAYQQLGQALSALDLRMKE